MGPILTIGRAEVELFERNQAKALYQEAVAKTGLAKIAEAVTIWESTEKPGRFLVIHRYADEASADRAIEQLSNSNFMSEIVSLADTPPDIRRYRVAGQSGSREFEVPIGKLLSLSIRQADPGLGWDLDAELARILEEIAFIEGFLGSLHGRSATVHEEILSLAFWDNEDAFRRSVPGHQLFTVEPFVRVA